MAIVYLATNIVNGKRYVGMTSKSLRQRIYGHHSSANNFKKARGYSHFSFSIRKHGKENFVWEILAEFPTHIDALIGEAIFIDRLKPEYNIRIYGGSGITGIDSHNKKSVVCLEDGVAFKSIYSASIFYKGSASDIVKSCKMNGHSVKGKHFIYGDAIPSRDEASSLLAEIQERMISNRRRSIKIVEKGNVDNSKYQSRSRKVVCIDDGVEFLSASEAARHYSSAKSAVIEMCLGKNGRKTVNGKRFKYTDIKRAI